MSIRRWIIAGFVAIWAAGIFSAVLGAQPTRTTWDGVYTEEQARRGAGLFDEHCAQCHGPSGAGGGMAGALMGPAFSANYDGQTVGDLFDRNRTTMPPGKEGQLGGPDNAAITAFMLQFNGFPAGQAEMPSQSVALKMIKYVADKPSARGPRVFKQRCAFSPTSNKEPRVPRRYSGASRASTRFLVWRQLVRNLHRQPQKRVLPWTNVPAWNRAGGRD